MAVAVFQADIFQPIVFQTLRGPVWPVSTTTIWPADSLTEWDGSGHDGAWPVDDEVAWAAHTGGAW